MTDFMTSPFGMDDGASTSAGAGEPHTTLLKSGDIVTQQLMAGISEDRRAALLSELDAGCSASRSAVDTAREAADVAACEAQDAATAADVAAAESTLTERESEAAQRELTAAEAAFVAAERRLAAARIEASRADVVAAEARGRRSAAVATRLQREQEQHERLQAVRRLSEEHAEAQRSAAARLAAEEHARFRAAAVSFAIEELAQPVLAMPPPPPPPPPPETLGELLSSLRLSELAPTFAEAGVVSLPQLAALTLDEIAEIDLEARVEITPHAERLLAAARELPVVSLVAAAMSRTAPPQSVGRRESAAPPSAFPFLAAAEPMMGMGMVGEPWSGMAERSDTPPSLSSERLVPSSAERSDALPPPTASSVFSFIG